MSSLLRRYWYAQTAWEYAYGAVSLIIASTALCVAKRPVLYMRNPTINDFAWGAAYTPPLADNNPNFMVTEPAGVFVPAVVSIIVTLIYIGAILWYSTHAGRSQKKKSVDSSQKYSYSPEIVLYVLRLCMIVAILMVGAALALLCNDTAITRHESMNQHGIQVLFYGIAIPTVHYTSWFWIDLGLLGAVVLMIMLRKHIESLTYLAFPSAIEPKHSLLPWTGARKINFLIGVILIAGWATSPVFLGVSSPSYRCLWLWDAGFSLWICVCVILIMAYMFMQSLTLTEKLAKTPALGCIISIISLITMSLPAICERDGWTQTSFILGIVCGIGLIIMFSIDIWLIPRWYTYQCTIWEQNPITAPLPASSRIHR